MPRRRLATVAYSNLGRARLKSSLIAVVVLIVTFFRYCTAAGASIHDDAPETECPEYCREKDAPFKNDGARIFYLILVHNERTLEDAIHLIRSVRHPRHHIAIHVDTKASHLLNPSNSIRSRLELEIQSCPCGMDLSVDRLLHSVHSVEWSKWSMNLPTLWGIEYAVANYNGKFDLFINLSGDSLPVYKAETLSRMLQGFPYNIVTSSSTATGLVPTSVYHFPWYWHKRLHYTDNGHGKDPVIQYVDENNIVRNKTVVTHFGSQWIILQQSFCQWLVDELSRNDSFASRYRNHAMESERLMTDETFLPTLLVHTKKFNMTLPYGRNQISIRSSSGNGTKYIQHLRYERMDEHVPTAFDEIWENQRYQVPESSTGVETTRPWGPYFLGVYDLGSIRASGALFVRKISKFVEPNMIRLLPVDNEDEIPKIFWPEEVNITEKVDWKQWKDFQKLLRYRAEEAGAEREEEADSDDDVYDSEL